MSIAVFSAILWLGSSQGLLVSLWLLTRKVSKLANLILAGFVGIISLRMVVYTLQQQRLIAGPAQTFDVSYALLYLVGPLLYLYTHLVLTKQVQSKVQYGIHGIPFAGFILTYLALVLTRCYWLPFLNKALLATGLLYSGASWFLLRKDERGASKAQRGGERSHTSWLKVIILGISMFYLIIFFYQFYEQQLFAWMPQFQYSFFLLVMLIYWISYGLLSEPKRSDFQSPGVALRQPATKNPDNAPMKQSPLRYENSGLCKETSQRILQRLQRHMLCQKPFLDSSLTLEKLAKQLSVSKHHLSQVLNETLKQSFSDFVSHYRVEEVKRRLVDSRQHRFTILSIAYDSGFNSKSGFNKTFKKLVGKPPSEFKTSSSKSNSRT